MDDYKVDSFAEFHEVIRKNHGEWRCWYYRGHSSQDYKLVPRVGRPPFSGIDDQRMMKAWKRHSVPYLDPTIRELNDWDYLAIAQHHGLATRLLDWTFNALAAAFFAVVKSDEKVDETEDADVYGHYSTQDPINPADPPDNFVDPFHLPDSIYRLAPSPLVPRIGRQGGSSRFIAPGTGAST